MSVKWARSIPSFQQLPPSDQQMLMANSWPQVQNIVIVFHYIVIFSAPGVLSGTVAGPPSPGPLGVRKWPQGRRGENLSRQFCPDVCYFFLTKIPYCLRIFKIAIELNSGLMIRQFFTFKITFFKCFNPILLTLIIGSLDFP